MKKRTKEEFIEQAKRIHGEKYDYSEVEYIDGQTKVCIICPKHGEFWQRPCDHINQKQGCPKCVKNYRDTAETFIKKAKLIHGNRYDYSKVKYVNSQTKVCIICPEHGEFWQTPHHHLRGSGCPECGKNDVSEKKLTDILSENFDNLIKQYKPEFLKTNGKPQSIDIFLPNYNVGVEYQGRQHFVPVPRYGGVEEYKKTIERDKRKFNKCKEHGITILYFSYEKEAPDNYLNKVFANETELINEIKVNYGK